MCQVIPLRRAFLNSLFPLANNMRHHAARTDLAWWQIMLDNWSGTSIHQFLLLQEPFHHLFSDASGSWGCGTFSLPAWLQFAWPRKNPLLSITIKDCTHMSSLTTEKVTLFIAYLSSEGLSIPTIQSYMAALRHFLILADPGNSSLWLSITASIMR